MGKWTAGIIGAVISGVLLWLLTERFLPDLLPGKTDRTAPVEEPIRVSCTANPTIVTPGGTAEVSVRVLQGATPIEGAAVELKAGGGAFGSRGTTMSGQTYSEGIFRTTWTAPSPSASGYVFPAEVKLDGVRTPRGELSGTYRTNCEILVH